MYRNVRIALDGLDAIVLSQSVVHTASAGSVLSTEKIYYYFASIIGIFSQSKRDGWRPGSLPHSAFVAAASACARRRSSAFFCTFGAKAAMRRVAEAAVAAGQPQSGHQLARDSG